MVVIAAVMQCKQLILCTNLKENLLQCVVHNLERKPTTHGNAMGSSSFSFYLYCCCWYCWENCRDSSTLPAGGAICTWNIKEFYTCQNLNHFNEHITSKYQEHTYYNYFTTNNHFFLLHFINSVYTLYTQQNEIYHANFPWECQP